MAQHIQLALAGDVMLGRLVNRKARGRSPAEVWGDILPQMQQANLSIVNLECVIAAPQTGEKWHPKVFHFKAEPWAIAALQAAGVDLLGLANNHVFDFHEEALLEMIDRLDAAGIHHAGAGANLSEAAKPAQVERGGVRVALIALTDNEPGWEAPPAGGQGGGRSAGVHYQPVQTRGERFERLLERVSHAREEADIVVASAHVGPHFRERPRLHVRAFAHALLDAGATVYMGTSNHAFQGVERYGEGVILYDLGDFVDDYAVEPTFRNDRSFLYHLTFEGARLASVALQPTEIGRMQVNRASEEAAAWSVERMVRLSAELGTVWEREGARLQLET